MGAQEEQFRLNVGTVFFYPGLEPQKGSGKRIFPVAEFFKPRGLKKEWSEVGATTGSSEAESWWGHK